MSDRNEIYAYCPENHLHRILIDIPDNIPRTCKLQWPAQILDYPVCNPNSIYVSQLRHIRVIDCPRPIPLLSTDLPMLQVKILDISFLAYFKLSHPANFISKDLFALIKKRNSTFDFKESRENLPKFKKVYGSNRFTPLIIMKRVTVPFEIIASENDSILVSLEMLVVISEIQCMLGEQFLLKINPNVSLTSPFTRLEIVQPGQNKRYIVSYWEHEYNAMHLIPPIIPAD